MNAYGARIASVLQAGDVIELNGGLGAGKTTLARAVIQALGYKDDIPSPTFTIVETYDPPAVSLPIVHADFYRLEVPGDLAEIGLDEYREGAALLAEWPGQVGGFATEAACLSITLEHADGGRIAIVEAGPNWLHRIP